LLSPSLALTFALNLAPEPHKVRNKDAVYMRTHGKAEVLGTADVDLRALFDEPSESVHALELSLSSKGRNEGQLHVVVRWESGCEDWASDAVANREASSRVATRMKLSERLKCLVPARKKVAKYGRAVDQHHSTIESFRESHSKVCTHSPLTLTLNSNPLTPTL
jgi:hypothetical protein